MKNDAIVIEESTITPYEILASGKCGEVDFVIGKILPFRAWTFIYGNSKIYDKDSKKQIIESVSEIVPKASECVNDQLHYFGTLSCDVKDALSDYEAGACTFGHVMHKMAHVRFFDPVKARIGVILHQCYDLSTNNTVASDKQIEFEIKSSIGKYRKISDMSRMFDEVSMITLASRDKIIDTYLYMIDVGKITENDEFMQIVSHYEQLHDVAQWFKKSSKSYDVVFLSDIDVMLLNASFNDTPIEVVSENLNLSIDFIEDECRNIITRIHDKSDCKSPVSKRIASPS
jgi:hypothetical protein